MSIDRVRAYFNEHHIPEEILEFSVSSATVELAAEALGVPGACIAKTLSFQNGESALLILASGDARVDNKKYKQHFGRKARFLTAEDALRFTGHEIGGVCPFALPEPLPVYLDISLKRFDIVYPAAGSPASAVVIAPDRLQEITGAEWIDVCTLPEEA